MPVLVVASDISFVYLDDTSKLLDVFNEGNVDLVAHEPSSLIGTEAHITVDLKGAHAFFADKHQVNDFDTSLCSGLFVFSKIVPVR